MTYTTRQRLAALLLLGVGACRQTEPAFPTAQLTATPATVATGRPVTFSWVSTGTDCTLTTGVRVLEPNCRGGTATETYRAPGSYRAALEVTTAGGATLTETATVTVTPDDAGEPTAEVAFEAHLDDHGDDRGDGFSVTFDASANAPEGATFAWDFDDGTRGAGERVTHRYARAGAYEVTLTVTSAAGEQRGQRTVVVGSERVTLFDGGDLSAWRLTRGGAPNWRRADDFFEVTPGARVGHNNVQTERAFGDFRLHLEFRVPKTPADTAEQARGNSGVYLQGRYEVQILDSFKRPLSGKNDAGAIYGVADARANASLPAGTWQRYDIVFRAARFSDGKKTNDARVTVFWNGHKVHDETRVPEPTRLGEPERGRDGVLTGPILLQDHGDRVQYRNIWLEHL